MPNNAKAEQALPLHRLFVGYILILAKQLQLF